MPGRPATIVLTSGALAVLDPDQLAAVLAHERAHLAGRHHLLTGLTRGLAAMLPGRAAVHPRAAEVARLAEMRADDAAARRSGRPHADRRAAGDGHRRGRPGRRARRTSGGGDRGRVQRLLDPPGRGRQRAAPWP